MRKLIVPIATSTLLGLSLFANSTLSDNDEPPLADERLSIHTLVREDIFAGWRAENMERHARGERSVDALLESRPDERADLLAWKGGATLFRAVLAHESGDEQAFETLYQEALEHFRQSKEANTNSVGAASVIGGSYALFADRLPEENRAQAWQACYESYQVLFQIQEAYVDQLPLHMRGELLAGLTQAAQRTGRTDEYARFRQQIIDGLPGTSYSRVALRWEQNPEAANNENISCRSCHSPGRLSAKLAELDDE